MHKNVFLMLLALFSITFLGFANLYRPKPIYGSVSNSTIERRVNAPNLEAVPFEPAIFWFGQVTPTTNHADVRMWHYNSQMELTVHIIDRRIWNDTTPSASSLEDWDAVTIYLDLDGNQGNTPDNNSYRFVTQFGASPTDDSYQATYRGNGTNWTETPVAYIPDSIYRGAGGPNTNSDNKGWQLTLIIPFSSFGLSGPPTDATWGLAVALHDRDGQNAADIPDQIWPEQMDPLKPSTWGQLHFGRSTYDSPVAVPEGNITIRQGLNGASVPDGHVGGALECGKYVDHWSEWGEANYEGATQINIQNQWDISEYPCFSKYFVTFPIDSVPTNKTIISARLIMNMFGNAGGGDFEDPQDSYIQVFTIDEDWNENTLTWNNAPLAVENIAGTWVKPVQFSNQREYAWDVTKGVIEAIGSGTPLRLALYSADGEKHSGKYFYSSDSNDWGGTTRPTLQVFWGNLCDSPGIECKFDYLPATMK